MNSKVKNLIVGVLFLALGAYIWTNSNLKAAMKNDVGSGFFPKVVAALMIALAVIRIILALIQAAKPAKATNSDAVGGILTIAAIIVYCLVFKSLGFIVSTILYLLAQIWILTPKEKRSIPVWIAVSVIAPLVIYVLFVYAIKMPLPKGIIKFI